MKKIWLVVVLLSLAIPAMADEWRKKAEENPLDCAFYLLSKEPDNLEIPHSSTFILSLKITKAFIVF